MPFAKRAHRSREAIDRRVAYADGSSARYAYDIIGSVDYC